jgi:hypothetical protein
MRRCALCCVVISLALSAALVRSQEPAIGDPPAAGDTAATVAVAVDLSVAEYAERLLAVATTLRSDSFAEAHALTEALRTARVTWQGETLAPDAGLLDEAGRAATSAAAQRLAARIEKLAAALRTAPSETAAPARRDVLTRVTRSDDLTPGGTIDTRLSPPPLGPLGHLRHMLERAADWAGGALDRLAEWLKRFWPRMPTRPASAGLSSSTTLIVLIVVGLATILLALLAVRAMRQRQDALVDGDAVPPSVRRDEDPLSREANEWELYAQQLAAAGQRREAIRAWYHAVLVTLFRTGLLHYAKGRTNWEYVAVLPPEPLWRAAFIDLTRGFDVEWYGHEDSSAQALSAYARQGRSVLRALESGEAGA